MPHTSSQAFLRELDKKLWNAADKLRSNLDAAVYKHAVLDLTASLSLTWRLSLLAATNS